MKQLSECTGIPRSSIHYYMQFNKISKKEYEYYVKKGYTVSELNQLIKNNRLKDLKELKGYNKLIDLELNRLILDLEKILKNKYVGSCETRSLLGLVHKYISMIEEKILYR